MALQPNLCYTKHPTCRAIERSIYQHTHKQRGSETRSNRYAVFLREGIMRYCRTILVLHFVALCLFAQQNVAHAEIAATGGVNPADPAMWTSSTTAHVGETTSGTVTVDSGSDLLSMHGYIAYSPACTGEIIVTGDGSTWTNGSNIKVGYDGNGTLNITDGGTVSDSSGYIGGYYGSSSGTIGVATVTGTSSKWTNSNELYVGFSGNGTLNISGGGVASSTNSGYIGYNSAATGEVTVKDTSSKWTNSNDLYVGYSGNGTLNIANGGAVTVAKTTYVAYVPGSTGTINFGTGGGTLTTKTLAASSSQLTGTGTIITNGLFSDANLVFNSTASLSQTLMFNNVTVKLNMSTPTSNGDLGAGWKGNGSLMIRDGVTVNSYYGALGYHSSSTGTATVTGTNSKWTNSSILNVGCYGQGTLDILSGGAVSNTVGYIGEYAGSTGKVTVSGTNSKWTNSSSLYVGNSGNGTLSITGSGTVSNNACYIGYNSGATGELTIADADSKLTNRSNLYVGYSGSGTLNITGGAVTVDNETYVAYNFGSTGTINFNNGTLTTKSLWASTTELTGTGTINTKGLLSDINLVFDSSHGLNQTFILHNQPSQNITLNLDMSNNANYGYLGAGWKGNGSLVIRNGLNVNSQSGYVGYYSGSTGVATIDGAGSMWNNLYSIYVGLNGNGKMNISGGGIVSNGDGFIGFHSGAKGAVTVDGAGSKWTNSDELHVGYSGNGTLSITRGGEVSNTHGYIDGYEGTVTVDGAGSTWINSSGLSVGSGAGGKGTLNITGGGTVTATVVEIGYKSLLTIDVCSGSRLIVNNGSGTIYNSGNIRINAVAGAGVTAGIPYTPISVGTWKNSGNGITWVRVLGGTWNAHTFTASAVQEGFSGTPLNVNLANFQRLLITDDATDWIIGASFAPASKFLSLTASAISGKPLADLEAMLNDNQSLLGGWQITSASSYALPAYLSFDVGPGYSTTDLTVWHYDGAAWSKFDATDLTCNGGYASFTVTGFSGYAISVPEPCTLALLAAGILSMLIFVRRKHE